MALGDIQPVDVHRATLSDINTKDRYEIDPNVPLSVPSTPEAARPKIFDASQLYDKHPRKYDFFALDEKGATGETAAALRPRLQRRATLSEVIPFTNMSSESKLPVTRTRSGSVGLLTTSPNLGDVSTPKLSQKPNLSAGATQKDSENTKLIQHKLSLRRASVGDMYPSKTVAGTVADSSHGSLSNTSGLPLPHERTVQIKSETLKPNAKLLRRSTDSALLGKDSGNMQPQDQPQGGLAWLFKVVAASGTSWTSTTIDSTQTQSKQATPATPTESTTAATPDMVPLTVTPEPRRLFGFGPTFQPPSETVMVPAEVAKQGNGAILQKIKQEGLMKSPTKAEINTFASFSM